ncbi:DNA polymerase III subunit gamma and tau [Pseudonocardia hispaniensis]|uniref:DNA polymerase III subunit gamma/tau n=1 Tax=Pseudonocardia hispaniensis TaxID=904933 RepID=A0ABW1J1G5_9PSEU
MALALYRKYRPARFADVVGQEHVTEPLGTALAAGRINHAYLFSGPRGCGKTSSARILARSLNCDRGPTPDPCGTCPSCIALAPEGPGSIDVVELDAASHGGVDDARELRDRAFYAPAESRYRVFIVDEAHMVTTQGFNALLKIVEEPPEHLVFVFATTEPDKVLPTIRSRTHHYPFRLIPPGTLRALLERICTEEGVVVAPAVYPLVIRAGGGSARDSLSVLDQLLAGAGEEGVTYERAVALLGVTDVGLIDDLVDGLAAGDHAAVYEAVDRLVEAGHDPRRFAADLLQRLRDLTLLQAVPEAASQGLVEAADDELARMVEQAAKLGPATLSRYGEIVHDGLTEMRGATAPRLLLELLCARMLLPAASTTDVGLLERLERMERRMAIASGESSPAPGDAASAEEPPAPGRRRFVRPAAAAAGGGAGPEAPGRAAPTGKPAGRSPERTEHDRAPAAASTAEGAAEPDHGRQLPRSASPAADGARPGMPAPAASRSGAPGAALDAATVRRVWPEVLTATKQRKMRTHALLVTATVRAVVDDTLVLDAGTAALARLLSEQSNLEIIAEALHAVLGVRWRVRCEFGDGEPVAPAPAQVRNPPPRRPNRPEPVRGEEFRRPPADDVPPPFEPPAEEPPPDDEEAMMAEAAAEPPGEPVSRRDPEEAAIELLSSELGARAIDPR